MTQIEKEDLLRQWISEYGDHLLRICYLYLKDYDMAQDVVQETYIKAFYNYDSFKSNASVHTWLVRIAVNLCKNQMRTKWFDTMKNQNDSLLDYEVSADDTGDYIDKKEIMNAICRLPDKYRIVVLLYYYEELTVKEVAGVMNITESTVKIRLKRAREQLKPIITEVIDR